MAACTITHTRTRGHRLAHHSFPSPPRSRSGSPPTSREGRGALGGAPPFICARQTASQRENWGGAGWANTAQPLTDWRAWRSRAAPVGRARGAAERTIADVQERRQQRTSQDRHADGNFSPCYTFCQDFFRSLDLTIFRSAKVHVVCCAVCYAARVASPRSGPLPPPCAQPSAAGSMPPPPP
eukprot:COSAG06_NODE_10612_length_1649_cov_1.169032_3_plen_181_part_01